ncbi:uncharacterized protein LOC119163689 [Rhipicephalus microplus]|uniref:uncharacterized protein LOC119163689 n=1 Tax=Rhipicephalus microplus TaxID=6941 RepID=UPI003F6D2AD9
MGKRNFPLLILTSACVSHVLANCPDPARLSPCTCDHFGVNCMRARNTTQLTQAFKSGDATTSEHKELWIQKTPITSFPSGVLGEFKFEKVHVESNVNMTSLSLDALMQFRELLRLLSVYRNALRTFEFDKLKRFPFLDTLNLGGNQIAMIPADAFSSASLQRLVLSHNPITFIGQNAFFAIVNLKELLLSHTRLTTLGSYSLAISSSYPMLKIHISSSAISSIHPNAFGPTTPQVLNLSHNNLTTLERFPFDALIHRMLRNASRLSKPPILGVEGNPFTCRGCSYEWLIQHRLSWQIQRLVYGFQCPDGSGLPTLNFRQIACQRTSRSFANLG